VNNLFKVSEYMFYFKLELLAGSGLRFPGMRFVPIKQLEHKQAWCCIGHGISLPGMVEWIPASIHSGIKSVDPSTMTVET
jgi:hypothetical protein